MTGEPLALRGCSPTPLASYLKALGVLRLVSSPTNHVSGEAADPHVRGWWENECFHLRTTLGRDALLRFFLHDYAPSPIIAPWNGGSGFYPKDNKDGFDPLATGQVAERFGNMSSAIRNAVRTVERLGLTERPEGTAKVELVAALRAELADAALLWLDAVLALSGGGLAYPELLGTGGNDGRLEFTNNFTRRLVSRAKPAGLFEASSGEPSNHAARLLEDSLLAAPVLGLCSAAIGQFAPGAAGGPNATNGYSADSEVNPWDFVLMLEGAAAFAGAATRRHQHASGGRHGWYDHPFGRQLPLHRAHGRRRLGRRRGGGRERRAGRVLGAALDTPGARSRNRLAARRGPRRAERQDGQGRPRLRAGGSKPRRQSRLPCVRTLRIPHAGRKNLPGNPRSGAGRRPLRLEHSS